MKHARFNCLIPFVYITIAWAASVEANMTLWPLFADGVVLQRGMPVKIWGTADEGERVVVSLARQSAAAVASKRGEWEVQLNELKTGDPLELEVEGHDRIVVHDVLVGEVWICSGQSNMRTSLNDGVPHNEEIIAKANDPQVRIFDLYNKPATCVIVQIAPYHPKSNTPGESALADVREAKRQVSLTVPHTALVVTTDVGEEGDIHPHNKELTAVRAALAARALAYGEKVEASGPVVERAQALPDASVELAFTHADGGLVDHSGQVSGFCIAGATKRVFRHRRLEWPPAIDG